MHPFSYILLHLSHFSCNKYASLRWAFPTSSQLRCSISGWLRAFPNCWLSSYSHTQLNFFNILRLRSKEWILQTHDSPTHRTRGVYSRRPALSVTRTTDGGSLPRRRRSGNQPNVGRGASEDWTLPCTGSIYNISVLLVCLYDFNVKDKQYYRNSLSKGFPRICLSRLRGTDQLDCAAKNENLGSFSWLNRGMQL